MVFKKFDESLMDQIVRFYGEHANLVYNSDNKLVDEFKNVLKIFNKEKKYQLFNAYLINNDHDEIEAFVVIDKSGEIQILCSLEGHVNVNIKELFGNMKKEDDFKNMNCFYAKAKNEQVETLNEAGFKSVRFVNNSDNAYNFVNCYFVLRFDF